MSTNHPLTARELAKEPWVDDQTELVGTARSGATIRVDRLDDDRLRELIHSDWVAKRIEPVEGVIEIVVELEHGSRGDLL